MQTKTERIIQIVARVKELQAEYRGLVGRSALIAKEMGGLLLEARASIQHRQWSKWLAAELDLTPDAAHRYITIHRRWKEIENHEAFPDLTIIQMFDVARGKHPRKRSYKLCGQSLDVLLDILSERLADAVQKYPEVEALIDAIDRARPAMESAGLLRSGVEKRKMAMMAGRRIA